MQYGISTSVYFQKELKDKILEYMGDRKDKYNSFSHFLAVAAICYLREEKK